MQVFTYNPTRPDFQDLAGAFAHKTDRELRQAYLLYRLIQNPLLMKTLTTAGQLAVHLHLPVKNLIKHTVYKQFCGGESLTEVMEVVDKLDDEHVYTVLDYAAEAEETEEGFEQALNHILNNIAIARHSHGIGAISIKMSALGHRSIMEKLVIDRNALSQEEEISYDLTCRRLDTICEYAADANVSIYIDAEESWIQEPIDALTEQMMERYNRRQCIVFNTLQMYRADRLNYLEELLERAREKGFISGIKLVRGAYWEKERDRAHAMRYASPVYPTKEKTDESFNKAVVMCLERLPHLHLCLATHNQESIQLVVREVSRRKLEKLRTHLHFSQLYGMSDNLTFALAKAGFNTSKYLPYGEVDKALPYLIRRAEENTAIAGQMSRELQLLQEELKRRKLVS
ncbi:proline dehydrogenase family protein [Cesiribacter sp. SM1]|uniref:proline dehydrogenase family protein n=1 Tax=Cesiribacter sp. SM1 TaxID=2861196 RepID=UPI001CD49BE5|nr:proline dehydrogenase family protein [Cesiribacter sp. SM1]